MNSAKNSKHKLDRQIGCQKQNKANVGEDKVLSRHILALGHDKPPDGNHRPVVFPAELVVVEGARHMAMAIVAADVVHTLPVGSISPHHIFVEFIMATFCDVKDDVLVSLTEREIILADIIRPSKVMDHAISAADTRVSDEGQDPRDEWQGRPGDAQRESGVVRINCGNVRE